MGGWGSSLYQKHTHLANPQLQVLVNKRNSGSRLCGLQFWRSAGAQYIRSLRECWGSSGDTTDHLNHLHCESGRPLLLLHDAVFAGCQEDFTQGLGHLKASDDDPGRPGSPGRSFSTGARAGAGENERCEGSGALHLHTCLNHMIGTSPQGSLFRFCWKNDVCHIYMVQARGQCS